MALEVLDHCLFTGPAFPEPWVRFDLEKELGKRKLLPKPTGHEARDLSESWAVYRRKIRQLVARGGPHRVLNHVIEPLVERLGYAAVERAPEVETREGREDGGWVLRSDDSAARLRVWTVALDEDLDAPARRGAAYRYSHTRVAQRVLLASGERLGLLTNGVELRLLLSEPARPDSQIAIPLDPHWRRSRDVPDSFRLMVALASPQGVGALADLVEAARLQQTRVTRELRRQAREAVEAFVQEVLDHPENQERLADHGDGDRLAQALWHEGLVLVYRLLFVLKLEATDDPARAFSFASTSLWRNTFSPSVALAPEVRRVLDDGAATGRLLEDGLRVLFRMFAQGIESTELRVEPLGGALFGDDSAPVLSELRWGERAVARLLDRLLWTPKRRGAEGRERVHYGSLDVEDLGRVYEALLELEPGIAGEPMCRLRRKKLEVVVPLVQGERYRPAQLAAAADDNEEGGEDGPEDGGDEEAAPSGGRKKAKVEWIEEIPLGRFYLRVGLGRKASGSYYTPHSFVRFLVEETLGPQVTERSPHANPNPAALLGLRVLDPAMGSGHFLVEACRFLGAHLYEACRLCDAKALEAERRAEAARRKEEREAAQAEAVSWRRRVEDLPDPDDELVRYLPSRSPEKEESGYSQRKAEALCRRLVAVHCLYGVDKNPLAVELAKLSLWIESHAEGFPLTFLDHRLVLGDSVTGPSVEHLLSYPGSREPLDDLFTRGLREKLTVALEDALKQVHDLEATVGASLAEVEAKETARRRLELSLAPFKVLAAAWAGGVMLGREGCDDSGYATLVREIVDTGTVSQESTRRRSIREMIALGRGLALERSASPSILEPECASTTPTSLPYEIQFPEVFYPEGRLSYRSGFHAIVGNPPWDVSEVSVIEVLSVLDPRVARGAAGELQGVVEELIQKTEAGRLLEEARKDKERQDRAIHAASNLGESSSDLAASFLSRARMVCGHSIGFVLPDGFHRNKEVAWLRKRIWDHRELRKLVGFVNSRRLFADLPAVVRFDLAVLDRPASSNVAFAAVFRQDSDACLSSEEGMLSYPWTFAEKASPHLTLVELTSEADLAICRHIYSHCSETFGSIRLRLGIDLAQEVNQSTFGPEFHRVGDLLANSAADPRQPEVLLDLLQRGFFPLLESKSFSQFDSVYTGDTSSHWNPVPSLSLPLESTSAKLERKLSSVRSRLPYFRLFVRETCGSPLTNERSAVCFLGMPGLSAVHSALAETEPGRRPYASALALSAIINSFCFDYLVRLQVGAHFSKFLADSIPMPELSDALLRFLSHSALSLTAQHRGYRQLLEDQLGNDRSLAGKDPWPVVGSAERSTTRAAVDAAVAHAYDLDAEQYGVILRSFQHRSWPEAFERCMACFEELGGVGLEDFAKRYDEFWEVPLNPECGVAVDVPGLEKGGDRQEEMALES